MNGNDHDRLIRSALTPPHDVTAPGDLGEDIYRALQTTPQRSRRVFGHMSWPARPDFAGVWLIMVVSLLLLLGLVLAVGTRPPTPGPLSVVATYHGGLERTGQMPGPGPAGAVSIGWQTTRNGPIPFSLMPVVTDGSLFVADSSGELSALNLATGDERWTTNLGSAITASPLLASSSVVAATEDGSVVSVDAESGVERWRTRVAAPARASLAVTGSLVLVGDDSGTISALDLGSGAEIWTADVGAPVTRGPVIVSGIMLIATADGDLVVFDLASRQQRWSRSVGSGELATPAVVAGTAYVTTGINAEAAHRVVAVELATGRDLWDFETSDNSQLLVGAVGDGRCFAVGEDGIVYALDAASGLPEWQFATDSSISSLATLADGRLYVASDSGSVYALDALTGDEQWRIAIEGRPTIPVVVDGRVVVGTDLGKVVSLVGSEPPGL